MRKTPFVQGEFYHIYNRGVDKRNVVQDIYDTERFIQSMRIFNTIEPVGSIFEQQFKTAPQISQEKSQLVRIVCYCLNPNHYHFLLEEIADGGISEFMKRLGGGYTKYFNEKYSRNGSLFQGRFKSVHVNSNAYLQHLSAYINLNYLVHRLGRPTSKSDTWQSSWDEYVNTDSIRKKHKSQLCSNEIITGNFKTPADYETFAKETVAGIIERRYESEVGDIDKLLLE